MSADWETRTVKQLQDEGVLLVEDGNHGEYRPRPDEFVSDGVPFIRAADLDTGRILFKKASRINEAALKRIRKGIGAPGDILLSHKGTVGKLAIAPLDCEPFVCSPQTTFWRVLDNAIIDRRFLYSYMHSRHFRRQLDAIKGETDMADYASLTAQRRFLVPVIDINRQRSIASVLVSLDDKIELNRRMNQPLESIAEAIFRDWFVDFGPTRNKTEGRAPYLASSIWSLFPECLDSEGKPKGWRSDTVYEIADVIYGAPFSSKLFNTERLGQPLIRIRDLASEVPGIWTPENLSKAYMVRAGDIVVGMDGEFRAYLWGGDDAWLNQRVCVFKPKLGITPAFVRNSVLRPLAHVEETEIATTVIHLGKNDIDRFRITLPDMDLITAFGRTCQPFYDQIVANKLEIRSLAVTRNLLLPKLMSGEISVSAADKKVGELL